MSQEIKDLLEKQARAFESFKEANDQRLKALEDGRESRAAELSVQIEKIEADMSSMREEYDATMRQNNLPHTDPDKKTAEMAEYEKALVAYMKRGDENQLREAQRNASLISTSDPDGGYLITPEMDDMIDRVVPTISAIAGISKIVNLTNSPKWQKVVKTSGMTMRRVAEGAGGGETDNPNYSLVEIEAFVAEVEPWITNNMLEDSPDLAADLANEAAISFGEGLGSEFASGNGVNKARGITGYTAVANASYAWGSLGYIASGGAGAFTSSAPGDKIVQLQHALKSQYRPGANFVMSDATLATVRQFKDGSGQYYLWQPDPTAGFGGRLLGSPVVVDDNMPAISANSLSIAYGNFERGYAVVNRRGTTLIRDPYTTKGKTKFNFTRRVGGGVFNFEAIKLMKFASS